MHASGLQRCIRRNVGHDSRILWTMKLHRQQLRVQANQMLRPQDRQRVAPAPSSSSGPAPAASGPAPKDVNMKDAESSTADEFCGTLETEDDKSAKYQRLMAGMPNLHETDVDVNVDAHKMVVLAAMPDNQGQWTQRVIDWDKKCYGAKSGTLLDSQKLYEGRLRKLANIEKLEVAEPIQLEEAREQSGPQSDQEQIGCNTGEHVRPRGCDAGDTTNQSVWNHCESSCNENKCEGTPRLFNCQTRHSSGVFPCEGERASRDHSSKGIGTTRNRLEMCESVVRNTRGEQVLVK